MHRWKIIWFVGFLLVLGACRSTSMELNVHYKSISGLTVDDRVLFDGRRVGKVAAIEYTREGTYLVHLSVERGHAPKLTDHARFFIVPDPGVTDQQAVEVRISQAGGRLLADGENVVGAEEPNDVVRRLKQDIADGIRLFQQAMEELGRDIQELPESREYRDLKRSMDALAQDLVRSGKAAGEKIKQEWLPEIQRHLDELRERLKQQGREKELAPLDRRIEEIRRM